MNVTTQEIEQREVLLTIKMEPGEEQDLLKKAAKRISREVNVRGFRRGKAPFNTIVRRFGLEAVQQEAFEQFGQKLITDALEQTDIEPYAQMSLQDVSWDPLVISVKVPLEPKVELSDYRKLRLEAEPVEVTEEEVAERLANLQEQQAVWVPVERAAQVGDLISMSVTEEGDEEVLAEDEAVEYELVAPEELPENQPDLTTPLLGLSAGETKTFTVTYPEDFDNEQYAGQEVTFSVEVTGVKEKELDPLDDAFAQQVSEFETLEELKENIRDRMYRERERQSNFDLGNKALEQLIEEAEALEWPQALEEEYIADEMSRIKQQLKQASLNLEGYLQMQNKTEASLREDLRADVVNRIKRGLVLSEVVRLEQLEISESEILEQAKMLADLSGKGESMWRSVLASQRQQGAIASDLLSGKAIRRLAAIARGEAPEPGADEDASEEEQPAPAEEEQPAAESETAAEAADEQKEM